MKLAVLVDARVGLCLWPRDRDQLTVWPWHISLRTTFPIRQASGRGEDVVGFSEEPEHRTCIYGMSPVLEQSHESSHIHESSLDARSGSNGTWCHFGTFYYRHTHQRPSYYLQHHGPSFLCAASAKHQHVSDNGKGSRPPDPMSTQQPASQPCWYPFCR